MTLVHVVIAIQKKMEWKEVYHCSKLCRLFEMNYILSGIAMN